MTGRKRRGLVLQARDRQLLRALAHLRVIAREDAQILAGFGSITRANTRLLQLTDAGLLTRLPYGTHLGGQRYLYALSRTGAHTVDVAFRPPLWPAHATLAWSPTLEHQLLLNRVYLALIQATDHGSPYEFITWRTFSRPVSDAIRLMPDAYAEVRVADGIRAVFFEADRGTEATAVWTRKVRAYLQLAQSGEFARRFQQPQFRVAVLVPSPRRLQSIRRVIAQQTTKVFWLTAFSSGPVPLFEPVWLRPSGDDFQLLF